VKATENVAFEGFVAARWNALVRTASLLTGDQQLAEDLVQTALEKTVRHWDSVRRSEAVEAYVRRIMYREQISRWRRLRLVELPSATLQEPRPAGDAATDQVEDRLVLWDALMQLGRRQRTVLVLRYFEDMSEQQVADALDIRLSTVKSTARRALAHLRDACGNLVPTQGGEPR
jgi:RNA polymerase sigma-70 factor (sigma-E family)